MIDSLIFLFINCFLIYGAIIFILQKVHKRKHRLAAFILLSGLIVGIEIKHHFATKDLNYYEKMQIDHDFKHEELKKQYNKLVKQVHPDKAGGQEQQDEFIQLQEIRSVLLSEEQKEIYDKFGEVNTNLKDTMLQQHSEQLQFTTNVEIMFFYAILLILIIILTFDESVRKSRKFTIPIIIGFAVLDYFLMNGFHKQVQKLTHTVWPSLTPFETAKIIRKMLSVGLALIRIIFQMSDHLSIGYIQKKLQKLLGKWQGEIPKEIQLEQNQKKQDELIGQHMVTKMDDLLKETKKIEELLDKNFKDYEQKINSKSAKVSKLMGKILTFALIGLTLFGLVQGFFTKK